MKATKFTINPFAVNSYLIWNEPTGHAMIIDPGMMQEHERNVITQFMDEHHLQLQMVLLTHMHIDHVASARWMADKYGVCVAGSEMDQPLADNLPLQAEHFRLKLPVEVLTIDRKLHDGEQLLLDDESITVLAMPGHSPGGLAFYAQQSGLVFTGDSVFEGSIGRTDLQGGDYGTLIASIRNKILTLPPETVIAPGHGSTTTVATERDHNPFLC